MYSCIPKGEYIFRFSFVLLLPTVRLTLSLFYDKRTFVSQKLFVFLLNLDLTVQITHGYKAGVYCKLFHIVIVQYVRGASYQENANLYTTTSSWRIDHCEENFTSVQKSIIHHSTFAYTLTIVSPRGH